MNILEIILLSIGAILGIYILFRVLTIAIFKSWFDVKNQNNKEK